MSTILRSEAPFKAILGHASSSREDGRPMHKSAGNSIEFDEGAERIGVDVMRWMFVRQRPEDNILFGYHTADEARRELLVLWNIYVFFVTYARLDGWAPSADVESPSGRSGDLPVLDRWVLSRMAGLASDVEARLLSFDAAGATRLISTAIEELSTWYLRRSRGRMRQTAPEQERQAAFTTLHAALVALARVMAPILPFMTEAMYQNLITVPLPGLPDSVHLTVWPGEELAVHRNEALEQSMALVMRAVDLGRTLRSQAGINLRQPVRQVWLALPPGASLADDLLEILGDELNAKAVRVIIEGSDLLDRRVRPLLPKIGKRLGARTQDVLAAARNNEVEYLANGGARLAGVELGPDEVEILSTPRPGTAVAHDNGLVLVIDTELDDELRAEGDARELSRAVQELRKQAGLELDELIDLWLGASDELLATLQPHLDRLGEDTLAARIQLATPPADAERTSQTVGGGEVQIGLRRRMSA